MKIILSLTSWEKRINNVYQVLQNFLQGTVVPDSIELNLSLEEFPNKEEDLPKDLLSIEILNINWCEGNTRAFKKLIQTVKKYYGQEYYLLTIDDDIIYRTDYVETMINCIKKSEYDSFCMTSSSVIGNRMIYKSSCFKPDFWEKLTPEVISYSIDDSYVRYYLMKKHKKMGNYTDKEKNNGIINSFNAVSPLHDEYRFENRVLRSLDEINKIKF